MIKYLKNKILNLVRRAIITLEKDSSEFGQCEMQETVTNYEAIKPYGIASTALKGCLVLTLNVGADGSNKAGFEYDNNNQFEHEKGEVVLFHPKTRSYIHLKNDGTININAPEINIGQEDFEKIVKGTKMSDWIDQKIATVFNGHTHPIPDLAKAVNPAGITPVSAPVEQMDSPTVSDLSSGKHSVGD